jgi:hypothetical protein
MDMEYLKKEKRLHIIATYAEADAPTSAVDPIHGAVSSLAGFLGAKEIVYGKTMPPVWANLAKKAL